MGILVRHLFCRILIAATALTSATGLVPNAAAERGRDKPLTSKQVDELQKKAESGIPEQQYRLAEAYLLGDGVAQDAAKAAYWYEKAARRGHPEAENQIGYLYQKGIGVPADPVRALHWYQLASASGLPWGKLNLGVAYLQGLGVAPNLQLARQLLEQAFGKGLGLAATYLGHVYYHGIGVPPDKAAGQKWFEQGVKMHDPVAAYDLGLIYLDSGDPASLRRAAELFRFSSGKGFVQAKHALGRLLVNEPQLTDNHQEALTLLEDASGAGMWKSSAILGVLARDGRYMPADAERAYYWFHLSELQGGKEATRMVSPDLRRLAARLPQSARIAAAQEAETWYGRHPRPMMFVTTANFEDRHSRIRAVLEASSRTIGGE